MRRSIFILAFCAMGAMAQSDLSRSDFYQSGDTAQYRAIEVVDGLPGSTGAGQVWNFGALERESTALDYKLTYANTSAAPNSGSFPQANLISIRYIDGLPHYTYYYGSDATLELHGFDAPSTGIVTFSDKNAFLRFPFRFGTTQNDLFTGQYQQIRNGVSGVVVRTGQQSTSFDAHGEITLPDGRHLGNASRLKITRTYTDVFTAPGVSSSTQVSVQGYEWYVTGYRLPIFMLTTTVTQTSGGSTQLTEGYYQEDANIQYPANERVPHLAAAGGDFETEVIVHNAGTTARTIRLNPLSADGTSGTPKIFRITPGTTVRAPRETMFQNDAASFTASGCDDCVLSVGFRAADLETASTAHIHQTKRSDTVYLIYPGEWNYIFDGAAILNVGTEGANVEAALVDHFGKEVARVNIVDDLAPGAKKLAVFSNLLPLTVNTIIRLESTQPISVLMLRGDQQGQQLYQNVPLPLPAAQSAERWIPHLTSQTGGFDTDIFVYNTTSLLKSVTLYPFEPSGAELPSRIVTVNPNSWSRYNKDELMPPDASHMRITGDREVIVSVGYRAQRADATTAHIHETTTASKSFTVYPGSWDLINDGFALVNVGDGTAELKLSQILDNGESTLPIPITLRTALPRFGKYRGQMDNLIADHPNSIIRIESTQPLVIMALRLSKDGRYLYDNAILPQ